MSEEVKRSQILFVDKEDKNMTETILVISKPPKNVNDCIIGRLSYGAGFSIKISAAVRIRPDQIKVCGGRTFDFLIALCRDCDMEMHFFGNLQEGNLLISKIELDDHRTMFGKKLITDLEFQTLIKYSMMKDRGYPQDEILKYRDAMVLSFEGAKLRYAIEKEDYPQYITSWFEKTLKMAEISRESAEGKHYNRAINLMGQVNWAKTLDLPDPEIIKTCLDKDLIGLDSVKNMIIESAFLAKMAGSFAHTKPILLVGSHGIGKTSIAKATAKALNLPLSIIDLSIASQTDAIVGTPLIYENATIGSIARSFVENRQPSMVLLLNELDEGFFQQGNKDVGATLLPLLDYSSTFQDAYSEMFLPLDKVFFIGTCNSIDNIPATILNRFEVIHIAGYTCEEKKKILKAECERLKELYRIPKAQRVFTDQAICALCSNQNGYDCRNLKSNLSHAFSSYLKQRKTLTEDDIFELLPALSVSTDYGWPRIGRACTVIEKNGLPIKVNIDVVISEGHGDINIDNICNDALQHAKIAYHFMRYAFFSKSFAMKDVVICSDTRIDYSGKEDQIGFAVAAAMLGALFGSSYGKGVMFVGGIDMQGILFLPERALKYTAKFLSGIVYAPKYLAGVCSKEINEDITVCEMENFTNFALLCRYCD